MPTLKVDSQCKNSTLRIKNSTNRQKCRALKIQGKEVEIQGKKLSFRVKKPDQSTFAFGVELIKRTSLKNSDLKVVFLSS